VRTGNYGIDSPAIVATLSTLGIVGLAASRLLASAWGWMGYVSGYYFLLGAAGMLFYSKVGKLALRERLLDKVPWQGDERVLDVGCGRGLLAVGAAQRLTCGSVVAVDVWKRGAISGNQAEAVLENARIERVGEKVEVKEGDARNLPFADETFNVVVSNFVVHEMNTRSEREAMMHEITRVLKPGGHVALVDFIFTDECVSDLQKYGVKATRTRDESLAFWILAIVNFGVVQTYHVVGAKEGNSLIRGIAH